MHCSPVTHALIAGICCVRLAAGVDEVDEEEEDAKLLYARLQQRGANPFAENAQLCPEVKAAIDWQASLTPEEVMSVREEMTDKIVAAGEAMWESGVFRCDRLV